jgi:hypothetical protein
MTNIQKYFIIRDKKKKINAMLEKHWRKYLCQIMVLSRTF